MNDFIYLIDTKDPSKLSKYVIEKIIKNSLILTFDILRYNKWDKILIEYIINKYWYVEENDRIYLTGDSFCILDDMTSFCNKNNIGYLLLYTKNVKNNILDTDKHNSVFIRARNN